jgi:hypothetical protein
MAGSFSDYLAPRILDHVLRNTAYTAPATVYLALSTTVPTDAGSFTEVTGGNYARQSIAFSAAASRQIANSGTVTFPTALTDWGTILGWGLYDASSSGNLLFHGEMLSTPRLTTVDPSTDVFTSTSHGFADTNRVQVEMENGTLPSPLADNTTYFVRDAATNTFKLALTSGGAAIDITTAGTGTLWTAFDFKKTVLVGDSIRVNIAQLLVRIRSTLGT